MRDVVILLMILAIAITALRRPWIGVLGWTWISVMNPHKLAWRIDDLPLAALVAGCTLLGLMITRDRRSPFQGAASVVLVLFMFWMCVTFPFSLFPEQSYEMWSRVMKIDLMILVAIMLLLQRRQIMWLAWVLVGSLAFYGVKGGIFTILTGGSFRVWGPSGSFIEGNNEIALALIVAIPLIRFLQMQLPRDGKRWVFHSFTAAMLLCAVAAVGSHSRGALLAIVLVAFMPDEWTSRMQTIETYQADASAMGRINAWWMAWNLAKDRFLGGGFSIYSGSVFQAYAPDPTDVHAAHSIYFQVLGEHGFVGIFLFLLLWLLVWRSAGWLRKHGAAQPESKWTSDLGAMCQVALVGYVVGGTFLSLAYFDLPYNLLVLVVVARRWVEERGWEKEPPPVAHKSKILRLFGVPA